MVTDRRDLPGHVAGSEPLSQREIDVLHWLAEGKTSDEIGVILGISAKTVDFHVSNICRKLAAVNRIQAVAKAVRLKIV